MKTNSVLPVASLLTVVLLLMHLTDDILRHKEDFPASILFASLIITGVLVFAVWAFPQRRAGYIAMLVIAIGAAGMPALHVRDGGAVLNGKIAEYSDGYMFVWGLLTLGVISIPIFILSARGLLATFGKGERPADG